MRKYHASPKTFGFATFKFSVLAVGLGLLVAFYVFNAFYASLLHGFGLHVQTDLTPVLRRLSIPWPLIATAVIVAPFVEETFFRGFVFAGLRSRYDWRWAAAISAALFAGAHLSLTFFIPAFLLGFAVRVPLSEVELYLAGDGRPLRVERACHDRPLHADLAPSSCCRPKRAVPNSQKIEDAPIHRTTWSNGWSFR